jgi:uncharacterized membrane protein
MNNKNWHQKHSDQLTFGQKIADRVATGMGSWTFIIIQTIAVMCWITLNIIALVAHWDPYPFILLNLLFSVQAAYAAPIIMMAQNRQAERDRIQAEADYETNIKDLLTNQIIIMTITILQILRRQLKVPHLLQLHRIFKSVFTVIYTFINLF